MDKHKLKKLIDLLKDIKEKKQIQGNHYKNFLIEPWLFIKLNNLDPFQANIIKYALRYKNKDPENDIKKIIHYAEMEKNFIGVTSEKWSHH